MIRNDIESLRIKGFRSIENIEMDGLPRVAVLIGANGSGKSNVLRFVEMLGWMTRRSGGRLAEFAERHGGGSGQLFRGAAFTERIEGEIGLRRGGVRHGYRFELACAADERLFFSREEMLAGAGPAQPGEWLTVGNGHSESAMPGEAVRGKDPTGAQIICETFAGCSVYHFRDTSASTGIRRNCDPEDYARLRPDGSNLAAVLHCVNSLPPFGADAEACGRAFIRSWRRPARLARSRARGCRWRRPRHPRPDGGSALPAAASPRSRPARRLRGRSPAGLSSGRSLRRLR